MEGKKSQPLLAEDLSIGDRFTILFWKPHIKNLELGGIQTSRARNCTFQGAVLECTAISMPFLIAKVLPNGVVSMTLDTRCMELASLTEGYIAEALKTKDPYQAPPQPQPRPKGLLKRLLGH